jgi:NCS2 family nucleobase:cation symporter-2
MGSAFVFIAPSITVGSQMGIQAVFGASMVCGFVAWILSFLLEEWQKLIPPLVTGTIVSLIGIKLLPLGFTWLAGGHSELYGKPVCFLIGGVVLVALLVASQSRKACYHRFPSLLPLCWDMLYRHCSAFLTSTTCRMLPGSLFLICCILVGRLFRIRPLSS